ncbi:hypothetical protein [Ruegeria sp. HKCCA5491]|uniref:hypothetical protein n=1 Tax=Ruegeria sp. HKCCA5491 TaxID=2682986 RepID=UPI001489B0C4|nr:hypothetical protein [Ruegeria sp. HKCCA5491]
MIRAGILAAVLMGLARAAVAQDVPVRSGEHEGYTRLVVQVPANTGWTLAQTKNGARLSVALDGVKFDTRSVFRRLTQDRLAAISQSTPGGALEMQFGCDCVASSFLHNKTMIVVDITPAALLPEISGDIPPPLLPKTTPAQNPLKQTQLPEALSLPLLSLNAQQLESQLSTRLLQGADRELVDLRIAPVGPRASIAQEPVLAPMDPGANITVTSALDELDEFLDAGIIPNERQPQCLSSADLSFRTWGGTKPFPELVSALRSAMYQEFDTLDETKVLELAKLYASHGFGAEAIQALGLLDPNSRESERINAIAQYMDDGQVSGSNPFKGQQGCDSDAALWGVLTEGNLSGDVRLKTVEQTFQRLPKHLRRQVGPALAEILTEGKELEAARRVLRAIDRVSDYSTARASQAKATVATAEGDGQRAETHLADVISSSDTTVEAPLALARLVEKRWFDRGSVSAKEVELAASYAVEFRGSEFQPMTQRTHAVALSLNHEFDQALNLLGEIPKDAEYEVALNRVTQMLVERADDTTFLRRTLIMSKRNTYALSTETAVAVATRLASLGFAGPAHSMVSRIQDKTQKSDRARVRAQSALQSNRPHQALLELATTPSTDAVDLRAQALQATGDFAAAANVLRASGQHEAANRLFWLANLNDEVKTEHDDRFSQASQSTQFLSQPLTRSPDRPLADARELLQHSANTRREIAALLSKVAE